MSGEARAGPGLLMPIGAPGWGWNWLVDVVKSVSNTNMNMGI